VQTMRQAGKAGDLTRVVEADVMFHELVLGRAKQLHCLQIWRMISPRVRAYFYHCGPRHHALTDIADEHDELITAMRTGHIEQVLAVLDPHILADVIVGGSAPQQGPRRPSTIKGIRHVPHPDRRMQAGSFVVQPGP
nr:FCD domain-containing protein [Chloroflexota bacterium]